MFRYSISWYIFTLTLLESIIQTHLTLHDSSHGFIGNNQRYFDNDLNVIHEEIESSLRSARLNDAALKLHLKFEPAFLDFRYRPLGVPHLEKVTLFNADSNKSIDMTSVSGSTVHFHSSFFEDKKIPPLGNTSFNVVFLGREEGFVESSLFIHTTEGHFKYNVKGSSVYSPYRLRPIVGIKLPINATFTPLIYMHNPHSEPLQIMEIYSSGGDFHLELPTGQLEGPKDIWQIAPLQTKAVIRVRFQAKSEQNHTAYVRIRVNSSEEILVVPLEVEVSSQGGLFEPQGSVDFGVGGSLDDPKTVDLNVFNPFKKPVRVSGVSSTGSVKVEFENVKLAPGERAKIGTATLHWRTAYHSKEYSGSITVKYRNGRSQTEVPFYLTVLEGGVSFDPLITRYFINDQSDSLASRVFKLTNNFFWPIRLIDCALHEDAQNYFKIDNFKTSILLAKQESPIFSLKLKDGVHISDVRVTSYILIKTNVSDVTVPLLSYNGKLSVHLPFKSKDYSLDLGLISLETTKSVHFLVHNDNPVAIPVKTVKSSIPMTTVKLVGCGRGDYQLALLQVTFQNLTSCTQVPVGAFAVLRLKVKTSTNEGQSWGDVQIETQYENVSVPVHFKVASGKLEIGPDRLVFDECFPGKICSHPLRVHSTFNDPMIIEEIASLPPDSRLSSKHSGHILARATKVIGHLFLDPTVECRQECYAGLQHDTTAQWLKTLSLGKSVPEFDLNLVNVFYSRYLNFTANGSRRWQNLTLRLDTSEVRGHIFKTRVKMSWPSLVSEHNLENKSLLPFPLTQIGNLSYRNLTIRNPSSYNLVVQLVLDVDYPDVNLVQEGLPANLIPSGETWRRTKHGFFFHSHRDKREKFVEALGIDAAEESLPILLSPGENFSLVIGFNSEDTAPRNALVFIRNNLTIVEVLKLRGQGAHPLFKFGNRKPGSMQPLSFELTEKHLKDCEKDKEVRNPSPNLTVKRSFTARNIGDVTIYVNGFIVNDLPCEGYGFKVLNCGPFVLLPNSTKKIDIAFTPDLTLSKITRLLILETSLNQPINYTLHTTIPPYYLGLCAGLIARPSWESYLSFVMITFLFSLFVLIVLLAAMDAESIKEQTAQLTPHSGIVAQPVLDLRLVGQQIRTEIRTKNDEKKVEKPSESPKIERYAAAVVPTVGRSKKKLAKKISIENPAPPPPAPVEVVPAVEVELEAPKKSPVQVKTKKKEEKLACPVVIAPKPKVPTKKVTKNVIVPVYEEETSSTTTDSSSNHEEVHPTDCATDQRTAKIAAAVDVLEAAAAPVEPPPVKVEAACTPLEVREAKPPVSRRRSGGKAHYKNKDPEAKPERGYKKNSRRDKQNKKLLEKCTARNEKHESPPLRVSPPVTCPVWGENRATFSDVVARDAAVPVVEATRPLHTSKPTMYVEPYKQTSTELGPIGSRRFDFWHDSPPLGESQSFFSSPYEVAADAAGGGGGYFDHLSGENWGNPSHSAASLLNLLEETEQHQGSAKMLDPWPNQTEGARYWNPSFSFGEQPQQPPADQSGYLWGTSPVWQLWAPPEPPKTPTRTPPGFDNVPQRKSDESPSRQRDTYSPFGTSNIWTQQQESWNYTKDNEF